MKRMALLLFSVLIPSLVWAQSTNGRITGRVTDPSKAVVVGARILLIDTDRNINRTFETDTSGSYVLADVPPGNYRLEVEKQGFRTVIKPAVVVHVQDALEINFEMALGAASESITVHGGAPLVNTQNAAVSTVVDRQFIEGLPLNGRSFNTLLQLTPGTVMTTLGGRDAGQFSVNGQRLSTNYFSIDGVSANFGTGSGSVLVGTGGGSTQAFSAYGGTSSLVSVDAVEEFRVETSSFAPEFGRSPGAQVIMSTRSGTNEIHGSVFDFFRNDVLDANDWFAKAAGLPRAKERQNDFGGSMGGPVIRGKTFFFASYEGLRLRLPQTVVVGVPSLQLRENAVPEAARYLAGFPLPNGAPSADPVSGQFTGNFSNGTTLDAGSIRLDQTWGSKTHLFARFNDSPSSTENRTGALSQVSRSELNTITATAGADAQFSRRINNSFRANFSVQRGKTVTALDNFGGAVPLANSDLFPSPFDPQSGFATFDLVQLSQSSFAAGRQGQQRTSQINFVDGFSYSIDRHQLKLGADFRQIRLISGGFTPGLAYLINNLRGFAATGSADTILNQTNLPTRIRFNALSLYAQDSWKLVPRFTVTYGVRWELIPAPVGIDGTILPSWNNVANPETTALAPTGTAVWRTRYSNFAPRLGIAYQLTSNGDLVLRAGVGTFFDQGTSTVPELTQVFPNSQLTFAFSQPLPLATAAPVTPPPVSLQPPYPTVVSGFSSELRSPRSYQWNLALEKLIGAQTLSLTYLGQVGRDLLRDEYEVSPNANFPFLFDVTRNGDTSDYHALQVQFRRPLARKLQVLANYTWSHSIDSSSLDAAGDLPASIVISPQSTRGSSDFDVRHAVSAAITYEIPSPKGNNILSRLGSGWAMDSVIETRTGLPINVVTISPSVEGAVPSIQPDLVPGQPIWITDHSVGGGRRLNPAAFSIPASGEGNLGRNSIGGFGFSQVDLSIRRDIRIAERWSLRARADFFNMLNHPNFADPRFPLFLGSSLRGDRSTEMLNQGLGGLSPIYQIGGPRSVQLSVKISF